MIIIGLLIGGTFGGMKLIENMQVNRSIREMKSYESGADYIQKTFMVDCQETLPIPLLAYQIAQQRHVARWQWR